MTSKGVCLLIVKTVLRGIVLTLFVCALPWMAILEGGHVFAASPVQMRTTRRNLFPLPWFSLSKSPFSS